MLERSDVEQEYGIHILEQVKVRDVYRLITQDHGILCLKSYSISKREIRFITQIYNHLEKNGFIYGPKTLLTQNGRNWITRDGVHYMLTNWVEGGSPDFNHRDMFKKALRKLAQFHQAAQGMLAEGAPEARTRYNKLVERMTSYQSLLDENPDMDHFITMNHKAIEYLGHPKVIKAIEQEQAAGAFVHGDFNYPNLVLDGSDSLHLIDFENTSLHVRMLDFSHILHRNFPWQGKEILHWVEYYDRKRSLSAEDLHLLYALLLVPYPIIRELKRIKKGQHVKIMVPSDEQINHYKKELRALR
ncbi:phosphotransferase [Paenibacillus sp. GCM10027628]|uniref:phosphotransferase n=1 Tax=Paenibacillus sp. GCM10027628 TaxID=3273413 RepID=UPI003629AD6A